MVRYCAKFTQRLSALDQHNLIDAYTLDRPPTGRQLNHAGRIQPICDKIALCASQPGLPLRVGLHGGQGQGRGEGGASFARPANRGSARSLSAAGGVIERAFAMHYAITAGFLLAIVAGSFTAVILGGYANRLRPVGLKAMRRVGYEYATIGR